MYSLFARYYDQLTANVNYEKRADYFCEVIRRHLRGEPEHLLLDLGCGTGTLSLLLARRGWDVIGVDGSEEMLSRAVQKAGLLFDQRDESTGRIARPLFLCQRMEKLDLFGTVSVCVCALDSINHVTGTVALRQVFERLALFVDTDGLLIFDANTPYKHAHVLANETFVYETDDVFCVWQNVPGDGNRVCIHLDFFEKTGDNLYCRCSESFSERAYTTEEFMAAADGTGFELEAVYTADTFSPPVPEAERLVYVMRNTARHHAWQDAREQEII